MTTEEQVRCMQETILAETDQLRTLAAQVGAGYLEAVKLMMECRGHVLVGGVGTSRAVAERMAHLLSCCGVPALFIHPADSLHGSSGAIRPEDVVIGISKGGETEELVRFAAIAVARGARLVAMTEKPESSLGGLAHAIVLVKVAPEADPYGMVATASSLANAVAGDAIAVLLMRLKGQTVERFGQTHPGGAVGHRLAEMGMSWPGEGK